MAGPVARRKAPFRGNARQRIQRVADFPFVPGGKVSIEMPRVGYIAGIHVKFSGGITGAMGATGTLADRAPNILRRLTFNLNLGASVHYDVSGWGTHVLNGMMSFGYQQDAFGDGSAALPFPLDVTADPVIFAAKLTPSATEVFAMTYWLPLALNDGMNFSIGLINLQAPEIRATLDIQMGDLTDVIVSNSGYSLTGLEAITVHYLYYEVPNPDFVELPPYIVHRCVEEQQGVYANGDQLYTVPRQGTLQRLIHTFIANGLTNEAAVLELRVKVNKTDEVYRMSRDVNRWLARVRYGHKLSRGVFVHDFWYAANLPAAGDYRDTIDTEQISTLESIITTDAATVLGVGNNFVQTVREFTQKLTN
jgi:hypothetical protein